MKADTSGAPGAVEPASLISFPNRKASTDTDFSRPSTVAPQARTAEVLPEVLPDAETVEAFDAQVMSNQDAVATTDAGGIGFNPVLARSATGGRRRKSMFGKTAHTPVTPVVDEAAQVEPSIVRETVLVPDDARVETTRVQEEGLMVNPMLARTSGGARRKSGPPLMLIGGGVLAVALIAGAIVLVMQPAPNAGPQVEGAGTTAATAPVIPEPAPTATEAAATPDTSGPTTRVSATAPVTSEAPPAARTAPAARAPAARPAPARVASRPTAPSRAQTETMTTPATVSATPPAASSSLPPVISAPAPTTSTLPPPPVLNSPPPAPVPATPPTTPQ